MKKIRRTLSFFFTLGVFFTAEAGFAQAPNIPKVPSSDPALKNAEAAQKASEKAEAAKKAAEQAAAASASAEKAAVAQKAAEKASIASAAAEKSEAANKSAQKADAASKSAANAEAAQKALAKAEAAKKAAEQAAIASASAEKAAVAQKTAEKASVASAVAEKAKSAQELSAKAQKAADKVESASVAADKAAAAQKAADKADSARKASDKAAVAEVVGKVAVRQAAVDRLTTLTTGTAQAEAARKAAQNAAKISPAASSTPDVARIRLLNQPAPEPKDGDEKKTPDFTVKGEPRNPIADRKAREEAARSARIPESAEAVAAPTIADAIRLTKDTVRDGLADLDVAPEVASKLSEDFIDPEKSSAARARVGELANASSDLQLVAVPEEVRRKIIDEVSRSADPGATANEKVGEAATEEVFGKDVAVLVPDDKRGKFREVFQNLADLRAGLETIGASVEDPEVVEAVKEGASRGVTTREETRVIFESAGQKVLDRQGFSPAKEGESFNARLGRVAEEQKAEQAAMKAAKEAAAAASAAKLTKGKISLGAAGMTQGAAGSTAAGRSVSARVEVGIGGGKGAASGAGTAARGTGTDASKATGTGGQFRSDLIASRLPADTGGAFIAGEASTGQPGQTDPGTAAAPAASAAPADRNSLDVGPGVGETQAAEVAAPVAAPDTAASAPAPTSGSSSVESPAGGIVIGGGTGEAFGGHFQSADGNTGGNLNFQPDGTFSGSVTTVTRDSAGNITSSTQTNVVGTWGLDAEGNVVVTSATTGASGSSGEGGGTPPADNRQGGGNGTETGSETDSNSGKSDDDDDDDNNDDDSPPPAAAETKEEEAPAEQSAEDTKEADSTPNPMDDGGGNPFGLAEKTGGRLGGTEARRQQRGLQLARNGGGAGGPNPDEATTAPTLLTPEEQASAARLINMKTGGGVTDPNPLDRGGIAVTDRDLKELHLRGNGGASGPTDTTAPAAPQDPHSPIGGLAPGPVPQGGNRIDGVQAPAVQVDRIDVGGQLQENVK
jgi:hypothetical protein